MDPLYLLPTNIVTRWASAENPDGAVGAGGQIEDGRKGRPFLPLPAGDTLVLAHGDGPGMVRRMWATIDDRSPELLSGIVLRIYWDGNAKPAVEAPLGDFFGHTLGHMATFANAWFDSPEGRSFNCRIPMPFRAGFKITVANESPRDVAMFFYDVNYTLGDAIGVDCGYFHSAYRRENPTHLRRDFEILPRIEGRGRFLGCTLGAIADKDMWGTAWWGEGEVKMFLDGDSQLPTLCGTGTEDYIGTGWAQGQYALPWHGCPLADHEAMRFGFYRLHGPDPVYFQTCLRVTIQQIGCAQRAYIAARLRERGLDSVTSNSADQHRMTVAELESVDPDGYALFERQDDWCATAYFYLDRPTSELPQIETYEKRVAGLAP